ncbi:alpha/beta fold hydrolase, partial [Acinetobacter baumannii]
RKNPSWWWLPMPKPKMPVHLVVGKESAFLKRGFPQMAKRKMGIPFSVVEGGHMFPLEHPIDTVNYIKELIHRNSR